MPNTTRDSAGKYASAASISSAQDAAPRGPAASIADLPTATRPGTSGMSPAASIAHDDHWPGAADQTSTLLNRSGAGRGGGMRGTPVGPASPPDYAARYRTLGLGSNEQSGQVQTQAPGGRAGHGADIPGSGMPGPADPTPTGGVPGAGAGDAADEAGGIGELADLAPLAATI